MFAVLKSSLSTFWKDHSCAKSIFFENQRFKSCCSEPYSGKINQASLWAVVATQIDNDNNNLDRR